MGAFGMGKKEEKEYIELLNKKMDIIVEGQNELKMKLVKIEGQFVGYEDKLTYTKNKLDRHCDESIEDKKELVNKQERLEREVGDKCNKYEREFYEKFNKLERENSEQHEKIRSELVRITAYAGGAIAVIMIALQYLKII